MLFHWPSPQPLCTSIIWWTSMLGDWSLSGWISNAIPICYPRINFNIFLLKYSLISLKCHWKYNSFGSDLIEFQPEITRPLKNFTRIYLFYIVTFKYWSLCLCAVVNFNSSHLTFLHLELYQYQYEGWHQNNSTSSHWQTFAVRLYFLVGLHSQQLPPPL